MKLHLQLFICLTLFLVVAGCSTREVEITDIETIKKAPSESPFVQSDKPHSGGMKMPAGGMQSHGGGMMQMHNPYVVKNWLMERNYQIKRVGDQYHITRKDTRAGISYDLSYQMPVLMPPQSTYAVKVFGVTFEVIESTFQVTVQGVGKAIFKVDESGNLHAVVSE